MGCVRGSRRIPHRRVRHQHVAGGLEVADVYDVEGLVEQHLLADLELLHLDVGLRRHPELAAAGHDVEGAVVVDLEHGPEVVGRSGQFLDFLAKHPQLLSGLFEHRRELVVLRHGPIEPLTETTALQL